MATKSLDDNKIDAGVKLLKELDKNPSLDIVSALWYYFTDLEHWEFLIYTPEFYKKLKDLKDFYHIIYDCISENPDISQFIDSSDIRLISNSQKDMVDMFKSVRETLQTDNVMFTRIGGRAFKGGLYVEDALLYRNSI